jgi:hypothetical protein
MNHKLDDTDCDLYVIGFVLVAILLFRNLGILNS